MTRTLDAPRPPIAERLALTAEDCRQKLLVNPDHAGALHRLGLLARETGQIDEAVELIFRALQIDGENVAAIGDLADTLLLMGRRDEALDFYQAAVEAAPRDAGLHVKLGSALGAGERWDEARACFEKALKLDPHSAVARGNLGWVCQMRGELADAVVHYRQAKRLAPDSEQIMANLGGCLVQAGRHGEAVEVLSRGAVKSPGCADAFANLAAAYTGVGRKAEATQAGWKAVELAPRSANALNNLGNALKAQGDYAPAIGCFAKAQEIEPGSFIAYCNLGATLSEMGRTAEALECLRRARELCPHNATIFSNYLLTLNYLPGVPRETLFAEHRRFDERFARPLVSAIEPHTHVPDPARRLRIGYVSADFRDHPVANFVEPILATHAAADFEIFCYANQRVSDAVTERLRARVTHWHNVAELTDAEFAAQVRRDGIDILVDLSGHTSGNRLLTFARKPAPIQVSMIGYMQTTGLSAMDYRITDEKIDPYGASENFSSEKLVRLAHGAAPFRPPADCPPVNDLPAVSRGHVTFASFNNLAKITPEALATWARILQCVPTAKLVLVGRSGNSIAEALEEHGIGAERLEIRDRLPMREYLGLHLEVDLLLDTFPYNGGTTSLIAAWMGVPTVSLAGPDAASRTGASLLTALGLPELIAADSDDYVSHAVSAATDLPRLAGWRASLRGRLAPLLGNGADFTAELEGAFREMWRQWCAKSGR